MNRTDAERIADARLHLATALEYGKPAPLDQVRIDAICMRIAAGIEALNGLPPTSRDALFGASWPAMWGMRNRIAHTYARVERDVVVATLRDDIPAVIAALDGELAGRQDP
ncbi:HepT-like ribonuclease domain-containing protein [Demequina maris]|uniref:HepT-like ribonuclease domain-containing protein n=1 Tax=Demequina maris TaxID=1638982 RepID=UPI000784D885|nr:HepT-like ribonuclease domain-containing protein [Demequina maris]